jgi:hypothetical protein
MKVGTLASKRESMAPKPTFGIEEDPIQSKLMTPRISASKADVKMKTRSGAQGNVLRGMNEGKTTKRKSILVCVPTARIQSERKLPNELTGRSQIVGNENQIEILFNYTKGIGRTIFTMSVYDILFPKFFIPVESTRLSIMSTGSRGSSIGLGSKIPIHKTSGTNVSDSPSEDELSLEESFNIFSGLMKRQSGKIIFLTDFFLLYISVVLVLGTDSAGQNALRFLNTFLDLGEIRTAEANVLFGILIRIFDRRGFRCSIISATVKLARLDHSLVERLENGITHRNSKLSNLCSEILEQIGKQGRSDRARFLEISQSATEESAVESLGRFVEILEDNGQPEDIVHFIVNIVTVMTRFKTSSIVLERGSACVESVLPFTSNLSNELIFELLSICFSILSGETFLTGDNAFPAVEGLQRLLNQITTTVRPQIFVSVLIPLIAESKGVKLESVLEVLSNFIRESHIEREFIDRLCQIFVAFHPDLEIPSCLIDSNQIPDEFTLIEKSLNRLCNPHQVVLELINIMEEHADGDFTGYPIYLQGILQIAWITMIGTRPPDTDDGLWSLVEDIRAQVQNIPEEDLSASEFGPRALKEQLELALRS